MNKEGFFPLEYKHRILANSKLKVTNSISETWPHTFLYYQKNPGYVVNGMFLRKRYLKVPVTAEPAYKKHFLPTHTQKLTGSNSNKRTNSSTQLNSQRETEISKKYKCKRTKLGMGTGQERNRTESSEHLRGPQEGHSGRWRPWKPGPSKDCAVSAKGNKPNVTRNPGDLQESHLC